MENPATWDMLTSSLAVCDLQMPDKVWAFLALQGLVRDLPGDRDFFYGIIHQEKAYSEITGPSLQSRIAGRLQEFGIALAISAEPDPNAGIAKKRLEALHDLMKSKESFQAVRKSLFCTHCGVEVDKRPDVCPACGKAFHDFSETCLKHCGQCQTMNPLSARFCCSCGKSFGDLNSIGAVGVGQTLSTSYNYCESQSFCSRCGARTIFDDKFCRICGNVTDDYRATNVQVIHQMVTKGRRNTSDLQESNFWQTRLFRLLGTAEDDKSAADLLFVIISAIQDLSVMKELLKEKGVWDEELYKKLRVERMISDHSSAGATPWKAYSYFPYTLDEEEFLKKVFDASKEEIEKFKAEVESISELS